MSFKDHELISVQVSTLYHFEESRKLKEKLVVLSTRWRGVFFYFSTRGYTLGAFWHQPPVPPQIPLIFSLSNDVSFRKIIWLFICFQVVLCSNITWSILVDNQVTEFCKELRNSYLFVELSITLSSNHLVCYFS